MIQSTIPIILASQSPRRSQLLKQIGIIFSVQPSGIHEEIDDATSFAENVQRLSLHKAEDIANKNDKGIIVGSDTIVVIDQTILGKPNSREDAIEMLKILSGKTHTVYTGFALVDAQTKKTYIDHNETEVTFRDLDEDEIVSYVATGSPLDKAGAYGIQDDFGAVFVKKINGDYYTVVGLPLSKFYIALKNFVQVLGYSKGNI
ncbi:MAG: Maf family protein [Bacteroidota bacterium]|nr:Maf family protein [Bacteroidota bacterium]